MRPATALALTVAAIVAPSLAPASAFAQDRDCGDFPNQAEAQQFFESQGGPNSDPHRLDGDADGQACETLPCPCAGDSSPAPGPEPKPSPTRTVERVISGAVTAELSYIKRRVDRYTTRFRSKRVRVIRDGQVLRDEAVPSKCDSTCIPARAYLRKKSIRLRDVDGNGDPEVLVDLFLGGASCCFYTLAYTHRPDPGTLAGAYARAVRDFGSASYSLKNLDGKAPLEFQSRDSRLRGAFSCGACGTVPIQIWTLAGSTFVNTTRAHPRTIARDARAIYRRYLRTRRHAIDYVRGYLTPYVAEMCLLDRCRAGMRAVDRARRQGYLAKRKRAGQFTLGPYGRAYGRRLKSLLRRTGYWR